MKLRTLLAGVAALAAAAFIAPAAPPHHGGQSPGVWQQDWSGHGEREWQDKRGGWHNDRDRYWRQSYRDRTFVDDEIVLRGLKRHHYTQFEGRPFWFHGRYLVKSFDRRGNVIMIEVNPYTGAYVGILD
jgi:hypothetical protein